MGKKKQQSSGLGRTIIKDRFANKHGVGGDNFLHTAELNDGYDWGRLNLQSVTEQNNLEEFLATAELAGTEFTAEKLNVKIISKDPTDNGLPRGEELKRIKGLHQQHEKLLRIPRRPPWTTEMSASEVDQNEKVAFLEWRRSLASLQEMESIVMTPYEKNLDFWRQLWRVIERSDIIVQIVDARNPLLFYCPDLETYVKEVDPTKQCVVLVNKADLLTQFQRETWARYFTEQGVRAVFWSALDEAARLEEAEEPAEETGEKKISDYSEESDAEQEMAEDSGKQEVVEDSGNQESVEDSGKQESVEKSWVSGSSSAQCEDRMGRSCASKDCDVSSDNVAGAEGAGKCGCGEGTEGGAGVCVKCLRLNDRNSPDVYHGQNLLDFLRNLHSGTVQRDGSSLTTVGMVGYPNVGKSSTINAILKMKKVPVSATPGRTKHFQTLFVDKGLMLCDCPGLVFPSFVTTKAELVVSGVLPIDQMRDHVPPIALVCSRFPRRFLEATYGILIPRPGEGEDPDRDPTPYEFLNAYASMRGYMTQRGVPDCPRASRLVLKDYVNGKLLYCQPPPGCDPAQFNIYQTGDQPTGSEVMGGHMTGSQVDPDVPEPSKVDREFFQKNQSTVHTRTARIGGVDVPQRGGAGTSQGSTSSLSEKPWKKHNNRKKKEKMRRVYGYLDK